MPIYPTIDNKPHGLETSKCPWSQAGFTPIPQDKFLWAIQGLKLVKDCL